MKSQQKKCFDLILKHAQPGSRVLEISCGSAQLLVALKDKGHEVCGTNYTKHPDTPASIDIHYDVDVRKKLPFEDESFDVIILGDIIEHISDHPAAMSEIARVLKTGGISVILSPNTNRINSRLNFLFTGFFKIKRSFIGFDVPADKAFAFHNFTPHLPVFLYQMHSHGLKLMKLAACDIKLKSVLLWLIFFPFIFIGTFINTRFVEKNLRKTEGGRFLFKKLTSFGALCGESWVTVHQKDPSILQHSTTELPAWVND